MNKTFRSLIKKYFPIDLLMKLDSITNRYDIGNNEKSEEIFKLLEEFNVPYEVLGTGTNRLGILIDGYAVKIALDKLGKTDNKREFKYTAALQPYVVKVYESNRQGLIAVTEYVTMFSIDDFYDKQNEMRKILSVISENFLTGDIGVTSNNYANWGIRDDGSICILDFAYIYALSYKSFTCTCSDTALLEYDEDFVKLKCPRCHKTFTFGQIRKRITRKDEQNEIGDINDLGYVLKEQTEEHEIDPKKVIVHDKSTEPKKKKKKKLTKEQIVKKRIKELKKERKMEKALYR